MAKEISRVMYPLRCYHKKKCLSAEHGVTEVSFSSVASNSNALMPTYTSDDMIYITKRPYGKLYTNAKATYRLPRNEIADRRRLHRQSNAVDELRRGFDLNLENGRRTDHAVDVGRLRPERQRNSYNRRASADRDCNLVKLSPNVPAELV